MKLLGYWTLFLASMVPSGAFAAEGVEGAHSAMYLLESKCIQCHGAMSNGEKKVKGKLDLADLVRHGIRLEDSETWAKVVEQIKHGEMPPAESEQHLSDTEAEAIVAMLSKKLAIRTLALRKLTATEVTNTMSEVFGYDLEKFDPFGQLFFASNYGQEYETVGSQPFMTADFLKAMDYGMSEVIEKYVISPEERELRRLAALEEQDAKEMGAQSLRKNGVKKAKPLEMEEFRLFPKEDAVSYISYIDMEWNKAPQAPPNEKGKRDIGQQIRLNVKYAREMNPDKKIRFDIRCAGKSFLHTKEETAKGNLPAGKYRMSFKATALNRHRVKEAFEKMETPEMKAAKVMGRTWEKESENWKGLLYEPARLEFLIHGQLVTKKGRGLHTTANERAGQMLHSLSIEDDVEREYSFEFDLEKPNSIDMNFVNGFVAGGPNPTKRPRITPLGIKHRAGTGWMGREGEECRLPCIRFLSPIKLERLGDTPLKSSYDLREVGAISDSQAREKIREFIRELSLEHESPQLMALYESLPEHLSFNRRFEMGLKLIAMSPDFIYLNYNGKSPDASARYVSYSLLKKHPSEGFENYFDLFQEGERSSSDFAKRIVEAPGFRLFLKVFSKSWLKLETELDVKKYSHFYRTLPYERETNVYLHHLFQGNRPIRELYSSDYRILNNTLARFYGVESLKPLDRYEYRVVKLESGQKGGIINQGNFFISHSSGVDPLPFARAKWISENVFDRKIPDPPNDIDTEEFASNENLETFKDRTKVHSQNTTCMGCHKTLDPIAFAMNNFDTIGYRTDSEQQDRAAEADLHQRIAMADREMASAFTRELISFIIGRKTTVFDAQVVERIVKRTANDGYRVRDILAEILEAYFSK